MSDNTVQPFDLDAIRARWSLLCGACDGGLPQSCTHPAEDPRGVILQLCDELAKVTAERDEVRRDLRALEASDDAIRAALDGQLAIARERAEQARGAVLQLGDAIIRANGWEPQSGVTVELSSALERLVVERDLLRESRDGWEKRYAAMLSQRDNAIREHTAAREQAEQAQATAEMRLGQLKSARRAAEQARAERDAITGVAKALRITVAEMLSGKQHTPARTATWQSTLTYATEALATPTAAPQDMDEAQAELARLRAVEAGKAALSGFRVNIWEGRRIELSHGPCDSYACSFPELPTSTVTMLQLSEEVTRHLARTHDCEVSATPAAAPQATCLCKWSPVQGRIWCDSCATARDAVLAAAATPQATASTEPCDSTETTPLGTVIRCELLNGHAGLHYNGKFFWRYANDPAPKPLPAAAPDPAACIADDPDHAGMTCDQYDAALDAGPAPADGAAYFCPTSGETESPTRGGFDVCCDAPELHRPVPADGGEVAHG